MSECVRVCVCVCVCASCLSVLCHNEMFCSIKQNVTLTLCSGAEASDNNTHTETVHPTTGSDVINAFLRA